jgi:hypothetical protein
MAILDAPLVAVGLPVRRIKCVEQVLGCFRFEAKTQGSICCWLDLVANGSVFGLHRKIVASGPMRTKRGTGAGPFWTRSDQKVDIALR